MTINQDIENRFGGVAAETLAKRLGTPPLGDPKISPATVDKCRGALMGFAIGEALGEPVEEQSVDWIKSRYGQITGFLVPNPCTGSDTALSLLAAESLLADTSMHPEHFAEKLLTSDIRTRGVAVQWAKAKLSSGIPWWEASKPDSAGTAGAARAVAFGLVWSSDPERAAYEAALSSSVTHGHPMAVVGSAAIAAAVALATNSDIPLGPSWIDDIARVCNRYNQGEMNGITVTNRLRLISGPYGESIGRLLQMFGTGPVVWQAVPSALMCATAGGSASGMFTAVQAGGDTDTIAAMAGACIGARYGESVWPAHLTQVNGIDEVKDVATRISNLGKSPEETSVGGQASSTSGDPVHVSFLIDRSGSMTYLVDDVVGGYNGFIAKQKSVPSECAFTAVQFDTEDPYHIMHDAIPMVSVPALTPEEYQPRGGTPLMDALGTLIRSTEKRLEKSGSAEDQIVVVFTDGMENASREWRREDVATLVKKKKKEGWTFIFMGANQDAYLSGQSLGFDRGSIQTFRGDGRGTREAMASVERSVRTYRGASPQEKIRRKGDWFDGLKEAERDHRRR